MRVVIAVLLLASADSFMDRLVAGAMKGINRTVIYDGSYVALTYPGGDVAPERGVCTDVIVRSYRAAGLDLQKLVHEDMKANFAAYPRKWGERRPDTNIDHRRVPNLMTFFERHDAALPITKNAADYQPGDVVAWDLGGGVLHIGLVVKEKAFLSSVPLVVHNIGRGDRAENVLFDWKIIGHYRYLK
jgi:uncharacterized protein